MIGAIIGDIVGSRFEFSNIHSEHFNLFDRTCRFTDDTILMVAIAEAILDGSKDYAEYLAKWILRYPRAGYSRNTLAWATDKKHPPIPSYGNGALLRAVPFGLARKKNYTSTELVENVAMAVRCSHDTDEAEDYATGLANLLALTLAGEHVGGPNNAMCISGYKQKAFERYAEGIDFDATCHATLPVAVAAYMAADSFEGAIRKAVSVGGDTDTIAALTGALAGAAFGVPQKLVDIARQYLPDDIANVVDRYCIEMDALPVPFWADPSTGTPPHDFQFVQSGHLFTR